MGTGRAILIMRQNPRLDFTREIVELATRNPAYDPQLEDSRAPYVLSLIKERRLEDEIVRILCEAIPNVDLDDWDGVHQLELAWLLVQEGYACLKETIYGRYTQTTCEHDFYALEEGIIEHDGVEGLLAVAERNGQVLSQNAGFTPDFWTYGKAVQESLEKLELAGKDKPSIKLFLSAYFRFKELGGRDSSLARELQEDAYELVRECVEQKKVARVPVRWIRRLSDDQVLKLAHEFLETRDKTLPVSRHIFTEEISVGNGMLAAAAQSSDTADSLQRKVAGCLGTVFRTGSKKSCPRDSWRQAD